MNQTATMPETTLVLRRRFAVPREQLFEAWTTPAIAQQFLGPGDVKAERVEMDARVGGSYAITMLRPDGERLVARGVYREIRKPERIICTWCWDEDDPALEKETLLTLEFHAHGDGTELILTHENFRDAQQRDNHREGWSAILAQQWAATSEGTL